MSKVNELIGEVIDGVPKLSKEINGEQFYTIRVHFNEVDIDVMMSEYLKKDEFKGKICVTGYLITFTRYQEKPYGAIYANKISQASFDADLTNEVCFSYKITKIYDLKFNKQGIDILPIICADYTSLKTTSVIYLCLRGKLARQLKDAEPGIRINGRGYLKQYRDIFEILVTELEDSEAPETEESV